LVQPAIHHTWDGRSSVHEALQDGGRDYAGVPKSHRLTAPGAGGGVPPNKGEKSGVATGTPETKSRATGRGIYLEVYRLVIVPYGIMAQIAQKRLFFKIGATSATENDPDDVYIDIASALTVVNRKQYHQVTASGDPLCYTVTVTGLKNTKPLEICTAPNTWTTRNAAKKTAVGWKAQLKNAGIRLSELPTYARRFRCAFDSGAVSASLGSQDLLSHLVPDGCDGNRLFTAYDAPDGSSLTYFNTNRVVLLEVHEGGTNTYKSVLTGATAGDDFGMIHEYLKSRRNMREETDMTTEFPDDDGLMNTLFAVSETMADDVVEAVDEYNIGRPYTESDASDSIKQCYVAAGTTNYRETFQVPLGLMKISGEFDMVDGDMFFVDVEAVYEM